MLKWKTTQHNTSYIHNNMIHENFIIKRRKKEFLVVGEYVNVVLCNVRVVLDNIVVPFI
jgi:hypothetical protein